MKIRFKYLLVVILLMMMLALLAVPAFASVTCRTIGCINDEIDKCENAGGVPYGEVNPGGTSVEMDCMYPFPVPLPE